MIDDDSRRAMTRQSMPAIPKFPVLLLVALLTVSNGAPALPPSLVAGALGAMVRAGPSGPVATTSTVQLYAARGEYEPFQIVVDARGGAVESVNVALSGLRSRGNVIDLSNVSVFREHYVHVRRGSRNLAGSNRPLGPGIYPDALIPIASGRSQLRLEAGERAVFWVDLFVPRQTEPGMYSGTVAVSGSSGSSSIPVSLRVWRQTLPLRPSLKSSFGMSGKHIGDGKTAELLLAHKLMPFLIKPERAVFYQESFGLSITGLPFFSNSNGRTCTMNHPPAVSAIQDAIARYPRDLESYVYAVDEIDRCPPIFPTLKQWARNIHSAGGKVLATVSPVRELMDDGSGTGRSAVDIWVMLPKMYDTARSQVQQVQRKGDEVWSYNALVQDNYSPKWQIDFDPIDYRIQAGFLSASLGLTGLLYSEIDTWKDDPWQNGGAFELEGFTFSGEDLLVYPGEPAGSDGPVPSMRLKWLRKGVEDFEYVDMLKRRGRGEWALEVVGGVAGDWKIWTRSDAALEAARRRLGDELDRLEAPVASQGEKAPPRDNARGPALNW
jgi:hypothetical protein